MVRINTISSSFPIISKMTGDDEALENAVILLKSLSLNRDCNITNFI